MSVALSPSSTRGEIILQPAYFTSSPFVQAARADVERLIQEFSHQYTRLASRPFALFKEIWHRQGWTWIQFKVFDARSRAVFLRVAIRLFSERIGAREAPLGRAAALFGLYMLFHTQPTTSAPSLCAAEQIEVPCDLYEEILMLPEALDGKFLNPIRPHVVYVQSDLLQAQAFQILPRSALGALSPRALPREVVVEDAAEGRQKKGRPSKRERIKRTRDSLAALERRCEDGDMLLGPPPSGTRGRYVSSRSALLSAAGRDAGWETRVRETAAAVAERVETVIAS